MRAIEGGLDHIEHQLAVFKEQQEGVRVFLEENEGRLGRLRELTLFKEEPKVIAEWSRGTDGCYIVVFHVRSGT